MDEQKPSVDEIKTVTNEIAQHLHEKERGAIQQIAAVIRYCGLPFAREVLQETLAIEAEGGMMLPDDSRRRTAGGVFFFLTRSRITPEVKQQIFYAEKRKKKKPKAAAQPSKQKQKQKPNPNSNAPSLKWEDRLDIVKPLLAEQGELSTVKVTLIGRPGKIEIHKDVVVIAVSHVAKSASLPKGVPQPPTEPTVYTVYIGMKQWRKVEEAISNPDDMLIIEGTCAFDPELQAIAVFTSNVTTKMLEIAKRDQKLKADGTGNIAAPAPKKPQASPAASEKMGGKSRIAEPGPATPPVQIPTPNVAIPPGMPAAEAQKLTGLYASASLFRQKIATIQAKPPEQQSGLEMTQKLLKGVEDQIAALEKKYS